MTLDEIADHFENVRRTGANLSARCPSHDDGTNSLSFSDGKKGGVVLNCFAGCKTADILAAVGLTFKDVSPNGQGHVGQRQIDATFDYRDEAGVLLSQTCRRGSGSGKKIWSRRPDGGVGWIEGPGCMKGVRRVLYRLPELLKADQAAAVWIPEGEPHVDRLRAAGLVAACNPGGAGKWQDSYNEFLRGRHVVILPDNDPPGQEHAQDVARNLHGTAATIKIVNLPGLPPKGDVIDYVNAGHTADELRALAIAAPIWTPPATATRADLPMFPQTDAGSGELIAHLHGDRLRYDHRRARWLLWSGHYWTADCEATIRNMAIEAARWRYQRAASIADLKAREAEAKFAIKSESRDKVEAALYFAQAMSPIADPGTEWDRKPLLLGCKNGVLDLGGKP